jgi:hypothetical protein
MFNDEEISQMVDSLILTGGIEIAGVDSDTGEILYAFTPKIKELMPELYDSHMNFINDELMALWEKGYVDIDFFQEDPLISMNDKSNDEVEIKKLSKKERWSLEELRRVISDK